MSLFDAMLNTAKSTSPLAAVLNKGCHKIGGVYRAGYSEMLVLTDDYRKDAAGGVPLGAFLLAAATSETDEGLTLDDEELVLLRVRDVAPVVNEGALEETRAAVVRDSLESDQPFDAVADVLTRNELQQSAFACEVLGTYYVENGIIQFGSDIDNVVSSARYRVYLPQADVLSWIASYPNQAEDSHVLPIGKVRLASTRRKASQSGSASAVVLVNVEDFVSTKTAVFGMTRAGKSNTIKMLVTAISRHASDTQSRIGQLIFDPQGEYANPNPQDGTALRLLGDDASRVVVYKMNPRFGDPYEKPLRINFLHTDICESVWSLVKLDINANASTGTQYLAGLKTYSMQRPPTTASTSDKIKHSRHLLALYALLHKAGVRGEIVDTKGQQLNVVMQKDALKRALDTLDGKSSTPITQGKMGNSSTAIIRKTEHAELLFNWVIQNQDDDDLKSWLKDEDFQGLAKGINGGGGAIASAKRIAPFHDGSAATQVTEQIWADMVAGRLSIVDLSKGDQEIARTMSENIITHLIDEANTRFISGDGHQDNLVPFQIVVEEAHNLFERGTKDTAGNPWVRLSKEAAKYKIGLVYATQEVTSVDQRILSNTSNFLIAHLNSETETRELSKYYDFKTWSESIRRCEDKGFVRMKTFSGKYIVPVQVDKFDQDAINAARRAAGLGDVQVGTGSSDAV